jgi:hypothetical protein
MSVRGYFRGYPVAIALTGRERRVFKRAEAQGWLDGGHRIGMVDHAWEVHCGNEGRPCLTVRKGRSTASLTLDLAPAGLELDADAQRGIRRILFKASCKAPSPAAKGRIRRRVLTPAYVYARVPLGWEEATAEALLGALPSRGRRRRLVVG